MHEFKRIVGITCRMGREMVIFELFAISMVGSKALELLSSEKID